MNNNIYRDSLLQNKNTLAIFDLDNTLLAGDSDYLWGRFLVERGLVDGDFYERENQRFFDEYNAGTLDIYEFLAFSLKPLAEHDMAALSALHDVFMEKKIKPIITTESRQLVEQHRNKDHTLLIITATNRFITEPIAQEFGIKHLLATEPEQQHGRYTGKVSGVPCFQDGKVKRLEEWLTTNRSNLASSWFYSDSHNDLPLLELVTHPVAVNPDETLEAHAEAKQWPIIKLAEPSPASL